MKPYICIYHGNCSDGFGAAYSVHKAIPATEIDFHGAIYGTEPPDVTDKIVIMVDFCYKPDVINQMMRDAKAVVILDHHKSAMEDIYAAIDSGQICGDVANIKNAALLECWEDLNEHIDWIASSTNPGMLFHLFDMKRSGAMIAWNFFHPGIKAPKLIEHIQDRDLWLFQLDNTKEIQMAIFSHPYTFEAFEQMLATDINVLITEGKAIHRKHVKDIIELTEVMKRQMVIGGHEVTMVNIPYTHGSDTAAFLTKGQPFAGYYYDVPDGRVFGLRSTDAGLDVSEIARSYGGGGHRNASGFKVPRDHELAII